MPLRDDMKLISTDDHVVEHPRVWSDRIPSRYRDVGPRIVEDGGAPVWDFRLATAEVARCAALGAKAISFPENPAPLGLPSFHTDAWDPVFAAAQEAELPLCMHFGTSGQAPHTADDAPFAVSIALFG